MDTKFGVQGRRTESKNNCRGWKQSKQVVQNPQINKDK